MDLQDKDRYERIRETLSDHCGMVELARVNEADAMKWAMETAAEQETKLEPMPRASWWMRWAPT